MSPPPRPGAYGGRAGAPLSRSTTVTGTTTTVSAASRLDRRMSRDDMFLGSRKGKRPALDSRLSRDDLYLSRRPTAAATGNSGAVSRTNPRRGSGEQLRILEEEKSPNRAMTAVPKRMIRHEPVASGEIQIGMALGSPAHPPPHLQQLRTQPFSPEHPTWTMSSRTPRDATTAPSETGLPSPTTTAAPAVAPVSAPVSAPVAAPIAVPIAVPASSASSAPAPGGSMQRSKTTRRKLFGIFGSRRHQETAISPTSRTSPPASSSGPSTAQESTEPPPTGSSSTVDARAPVASSAAAASTAAASEQPRPSALGRSGTKKYQPIVIPTMDPDLALSSAAPASRTDSAARDARMRPLLRSKTSEPAVDQRRGMATGSGTATMPSYNGAKSSAPSIATSPFLNVEIPDVHLERYSVMFGSVLNPESSALPPSSSLLARRQATLNRLKMINGGVLQGDPDCTVADMTALCPPQPLQRRATSPRLATSPVLSQLPGRSPGGERGTSNAGTGTDDRGNATATPVGVALPSPRFRANTSPSVVRPLASTQKQPRWMNPLRGNPATYTAPRRAATVTAASSSSTGPRAAHYEPVLSSSIMESPTSMDYSTAGEDDGDGPTSPQVYQPLMPVLTEPQWQLMAPLPSAIASPSSAGSGSTSNSTSNSMSSNSTSNVALDNEQDKDKLLQSAVELSIARQISISRQQRQLLRPLQTSGAAIAAARSPGKGSGSSSSGDGGAYKITPSPAMSSPSSRSAASAIRLGRSERLQETRTATPTLVLTETIGTADGPSQNKQLPRQQKDDWLNAPYQMQNMRLSPVRYNGNSPTVVQATQNRKSELVVLEAA